MCNPIMPVTWLNAVHGSDIDTAGGKGASLGELRGAGLPVPSAFIVTADTYRTFIEEAGIAKELFEVVDFDNEDSTALAAAEQRARELIMNAEWPETIQSTIRVRLRRQIKRLRSIDEAIVVDGVGRECAKPTLPRSHTTATDFPVSRRANRRYRARARCRPA